MRILPYILLALVLCAMAFYRLATTDPEWQSLASQAEAGDNAR